MSMRGFGLALTLVTALTACEAVESVAPEAASYAMGAIDTEISVASSPLDSDRPGGGGGSQLFERLAAEIPGFAGLYRTARCTIVVVLTDMSQAEQAIQIVYDAVSGLVGRGCAESLEVRASQGQFTYFELQRWASNAEPVLRIDGVAALHIDFKLNRIVIAVRTRRVIETVLDELARLDVPHDAVVFTGTGGGRGR